MGPSKIKISASFSLPPKILLNSVSEHLFYSVSEHLFYSVSEHLFYSVSEHLFYSVCEHLFYSVSEHLFYSVSEHFFVLIRMLKYTCMLCVAAQLSILTGVRSSKLLDLTPVRIDSYFCYCFSVVILGRLDCIHSRTLSCPPKITLDIVIKFCRCILKPNKS